jgi:small-conductance mechanosensitive channel
VRGDRSVPVTLSRPAQGPPYRGTISSANGPSGTSQFVEFAGPTHALKLFGVKLVGIDAENGKKLLFTLGLIVVLPVLSKLLRLLTRVVSGRGERAAFWTRQGIHLFTALVVIVGTVSIWFDDPARLTTALGLVTAGLAFALQRVVTAVAGYGLILRGKTFNVGDRIVMGGARGDVIALGFLQTTIMEMGQPPPVQNADPAMWVRARQHTGRIVTVSNAPVFDEPVLKYSREFPFAWEEMMIPIAYRDDWAAVERLLLGVAARHTMMVTDRAEPALKVLEDRYAITRAYMDPTVFLRMTDNWVELSLRFLAEDHGVRRLKDRMTRDVLAGMTAAGIGVASGTYEIVGLPPVRVELPPGPAARPPSEAPAPAIRA